MKTLHAAAISLGTHPLADPRAAVANGSRRPSNNAYPSDNTMWPTWLTVTSWASCVSGSNGSALDEVGLVAWRSSEEIPDKRRHEESDVGRVMWQKRKSGRSGWSRARESNLPNPQCMAHSAQSICTSLQLQSAHAALSQEPHFHLMLQSNARCTPR